MVGLPVAGSLTEVTWKVNVFASILSSLPSETLKLNLA